MSTKDLVNAIIVGDALEINKAFKSTVVEKISERIEERRQKVAQSMFVKEESELDEEQLDELSKGTLGSYTKKAAGSIAVNAHKAGSGDNKAFAKVGKRLVGVNKAATKLAKEEPELDDEDEEQLDELSKGTLGSYTKKAAGSIATSAHRAASGDSKAFAKVGKRLVGVNKAATKLAKEEPELDDEDEEQLDELSKGTLGSYTKKAAGSIAVNAHKAGSGDNKAFAKVGKRLVGVNKATSKLAKEDVNYLEVSNIESALYAIEDGRGVLDNQIEEVVSADSKIIYESVNMKSPNGAGEWMFTSVHPKSYNVELHKEQTVCVSGKFADAAKKAASYFKENGHKGNIHILA